MKKDFLGRCEECKTYNICEECFKLVREEIRKTLKEPRPFDKNDITIGEYYENHLKEKSNESSSNRE